MDQKAIRVMRESNEAGIHFLRIEIEAANTFLDIANVTGLQPTRKRTVGNAVRAYELVNRLMPRLDLTPAEETELMRDLTVLKKRLDDGAEFMDS